MHYTAGQPTPSSAIVLTYEDYRRMPDDGKRREILDGVLHVSPSPRPRHQRIARSLFTHLHEFVCRHRSGEVFYAPLDVILSETDIVQPDIVFVERSQRHIVVEENVRGAPYLVLEVLSPSNRNVDLHEKLQIYARHGVPHYWIIDPDEETLTELSEPGGLAYGSVRVFEADAAFAPRALDGLTIALKRVFESPGD